ncbi:hypothetical protein [Fuerstiella marisgermanici]|uniref:ABC-type transport system involved in multi-copper enzyme maturation, permease component n=1 Tax=Fuerstiella marisgermanici TaxID=1891926 RepID=A0A1P8WGJ3_9PLAN|nr:hypothetical protein [Fuerstiella marisgermanici]APZ93188.1 ABC-type transport system involved in multi-copper enzyme maturation, permease component [Fuerstiella marisgermanici]
MPIHNLGYREWEGQRESGNSRWSVIAGVGIRRAWQSKWLRRIAFVVWAPPLAYGILIFLFEQVLTGEIATRQGERSTFLDVLTFFLPSESMNAVRAGLYAANTAVGDELLTVARPIFWKSVLLQLQRSQTIGLILVVGLVAPPLISQDVRSRAFLLYFSRPLTRLQYIAGKFATVAAFLLLICTLPQLMLYVFAVLLSPDISVVAYTWDLPLRAIVASCVTIIPTTMLALMLSSLTTETRFATFGWFLIWIFGLAAFAVISNFDAGTSQIVLRIGFLFLLFSDLSTWILDIPARVPFRDTQIAFAIALTVICTAIIFRKVSAPLRA